MEFVPHNPTAGVYPASDDYVHAMEVRDSSRLLYVAGTMGLDEHGVPGATLDEQLDLTRKLGSHHPRSQVFS